jgi:hypothetical protein
MNVHFENEMRTFLNHRIETMKKAAADFIGKKVRLINDEPSKIFKDAMDLSKDFDLKPWRSGDNAQIQYVGFYVSKFSIYIKCSMLFWNTGEHGQHGHYNKLIEDSRFLCELKDGGVLAKVSDYDDFNLINPETEWNNYFEMEQLKKQFEEKRDRLLYIHRGYR